MFGLSNFDLRDKKSGEQFTKLYSKEETLNEDLKKYADVIEAVSVSYDFSPDTFGKERFLVLFRVK